MEAVVKTTAAGCLFTARRDGVTYLLLGKERSIEGWADGSNRWSAFSGRLLSGEDVDACAARESLEESLGVPFGVGTEHFDVQKQISESTIGSVDYVVQGSCCLCRSVLFVIRIEYDEEIPRKFGDTRSGLEHINRARKIYARQKRYHGAAPEICIPGTRVSESLMVTGCRLSPSTHCDVRVFDRETSEAVVFRLELDECQSRDLESMLEARRHFLSTVQRGSRKILRHPAVNVTELDSEIMDVSVKSSFLEKSEVRWWSCEELRAAMESDAAREFRPHFLASLPKILQICEDHFAPSTCE